MLAAIVEGSLGVKFLSDAQEEAKASRIALRAGQAHLPRTIVSGGRTEVAGRLYDTPVPQLPKHPAGTCCAGGVLRLDNRQLS